MNCIKIILAIAAFLSLSSLAMSQEMEFRVPTPPVMEVPVIASLDDGTMEQALTATPEITESGTKVTGTSEETATSEAQ